MVRQNRTSHYITGMLVCAIPLMGLMLCHSPRTLAQGTDDYTTERQRAFQLLDDGRFLGAQEKFEKLATANPADGPVQYGVGMTVLINSKNIKDPEERRQARIRARNSFLRAKELGYKSDLLEAGLAQVPPDGSEVLKYSQNPEADKAIQEGEAAFARSDYDVAIAAYERALKLDPQLYYAAVFMGDVYSIKQQVDKAGEWYGRAITIDPDRETAYRYWSRALLKNNKMEEAKAKAIEAIIAEPYSRLAYNGLLEWGQVNQVLVGHPQIKQPDPVMRPATENGKTTILVDPKALDPKQGAAYYWSFYDLTRSAYPATFQKDYPNEKTYRHSLKEEATALRIVAEMVANDVKAGKLKFVNDPSLAILLKLHQANLIEAYVLFARADDGISQDYEAYRRDNRAALRRYWSEFAVAQ